ncbi:hypothetical protein CAPTEDRAFT_160006 [Capitella teleta]|uniref:LIM zinc-binding domain-containing protein n=1 Tax=Capitella teleta TaxID=283909 RepID=R7UDX2_CAPTE|nr:hypothetical protein CAPTEDRAFT_160006 [Capitella teleta]|eukprot:ELU04605.1 hypothetical protein CAPTEDRAFT_160006 [Capitella teleta]
MGRVTYGGTGVSYECKRVQVTTPGAPTCPRCNDRVYFNEEKKALGKSWHTKCFTCALCKKSLSSNNSANHEDEIYCVACHRKNFGPKGYGFAGGAAGLSTDATFLTQRRPSTSSTSPGSDISSRAVPAGVGGFSGVSGVSGVSTSYPAPPSSAAHEKFNSMSAECCPRCQKKVYFAEEVRVGLRKYHKLCFKCDNCKKLLEASRVNEHEDSLYCQACYGKKFGPKGYGFSGGAATLMTSEKSSFPSSHQTHSSAQSQEWTEPIHV